MVPTFTFRAFAKMSAEAGPTSRKRTSKKGQQPQMSLLRLNNDAVDGTGGMAVMRC